MVLVVKISPAKAGDSGDAGPLEEGMATHSVFLPREFDGQRSLAGNSPWGHKESDVIEQVTLEEV